MDRNSEKAESMPLRFSKEQAADLGFTDPRPTNHPPHRVNQPPKLKTEAPRSQHMRKDISGKLTNIKRPSDYQIRHLNTEINELTG
ncbi:hypothetical protein B9Z19DRAFT_1163559 [Tuber borchii]|uniref:Uncharacterized protein n=1 Tax=Tuber borchii TaxID=42251 RepID=A0A2T7A2B6_TUBBO|nr:hypothetical protein B9Z19DRAFT_1163559 [Tuber borchii]